jgi:hypothetical membrane protein
MSTVGRSGIATSYRRSGSPVPPAAASGVSEEQPATRWRFLVLVGVAGSALFTASFLAQGALRPSYDPWRQPISALSLGPDGWIQSLSFVVFGLLVAGSAVGWRSLLRSGTGAAFIPICRALTGLGLILDGIFSQDPGQGYPPGIASPTTATLHAEIHQLGAFLAITTLALASFAFALRFAREPGRRRWALYAGAAGALTLIFISLFGASAAQGPAGLFERLASGTQTIWGTAVAVLLLTARSPRRA